MPDDVFDAVRAEAATVTADDDDDNNLIGYKGSLVGISAGRHVAGCW